MVASFLHGVVSLVVDCTDFGQQRLLALIALRGTCMCVVVQNRFGPSSRANFACCFMLLFRWLLVMWVKASSVSCNDTSTGHHEWYEEMNVLLC